MKIPRPMSSIAKLLRIFSGAKQKPFTIPTPQDCIFDASKIIPIKESGLYSWGKTAEGQTGVISVDFQVTPFKLKLNPNNPSSCDFIPKSLISGNQHQIALTTDGNVFSWGNNRYGQLGLTSTESGSGSGILSVFDDDYEDFQELATVIPKLSCPINGSNYYDELQRRNHDKIISIASGNWHNVALTQAGKLYTWGGGFLGHGDGIFDANPRLLPSSFFNGNFIKKIWAKHNYSIVEDSKGYFWIWGRYPSQTPFIDNENTKTFPKPKMHNFFLNFSLQEQQDMKSSKNLSDSSALSPILISSLNTHEHKIDEIYPNSSYFAVLLEPYHNSGRHLGNELWIYGTKCKQAKELYPPTMVHSQEEGGDLKNSFAAYDEVPNGIIQFRSFTFKKIFTGIDYILFIDDDSMLRILSLPDTDQICTDEPEILLSTKPKILYDKVTTLSQMESEFNSFSWKVTHASVGNQIVFFTTEDGYLFQWFNCNNSINADYLRTNIPTPFVYLNDSNLKFSLLNASHDFASIFVK